MRPSIAEYLTFAAYIGLLLNVTLGQNLLVATVGAMVATAGLAVAIHFVVLRPLIIRRDRGDRRAEACLTMGREQAAVALAIVSTKDPGHFRTTPGGYFHGMVAKAKNGALNLDRTIWAMRRAMRECSSRWYCSTGPSTDRTQNDSHS